MYVINSFDALHLLFKRSVTTIYDRDCSLQVLGIQSQAHSRSQSCDPLGQRLGSRALAGSNLTVRDSRTSDRSAQSRIFFKMVDQGKSLTRGVESWNGNSRFKRHHIERKEVRGFEAICACHFAVKYLKYTIKFLR